MNKLLVILGPTATGKTDLAIRLAHKFQGELVSVDSRQVYVGLNIGTGKLPGSGKGEVRRGRGFWEIDGIKIWMYDVVDPNKQYTVADYVKDANKVIGDIEKRGKLPIIVGGTGFYLKALLEGLDSLAVPMDKKLRKKLDELSLRELQERLKLVSIKRWEKMNMSDRANPRRLIRMLELSTLPRIGRSPRPLGARDDILKIGLAAPRKDLYQKVDEHVVNRINQGMIEEAKRLYKSGLTIKRMRQLGLEYKSLADYLDGKIKSKKELVKIMQNKIHGFVRRQLTWFKNPSTSSGYIKWFDITNKDFPDNMERLVTKWYHHPDDTKNRHFS